MLSLDSPLVGIVLGFIGGRAMEIPPARRTRFLAVAIPSAIALALLPVPGFALGGWLLGVSSRGDAAGWERVIAVIVLLLAFANFLRSGRD